LRSFSLRATQSRARYDHRIAGADHHDVAESPVGKRSPACRSGLSSEPEKRIGADGSLAPPGCLGERASAATVHAAEREDREIESPRCQRFRGVGLKNTPLPIEEGWGEV